MKNIATLQDREFVFRLLKKLKMLRAESFSGVGIIFYLDLDGLPNTALGSRNTTIPNLPISCIERIAKTLTNISEYSSPWHDGFHLIDIKSKSLTHISQYLAPPLHDLSKLSKNRPHGARQMTAMLSSMILGIAYVGVLSTNDEIIVYENGEIQTRETEHHE